MRSLRFLAPLALLVAAACGGGESSLDQLLDRTDPVEEPAEEPTVDDGDTATETTVATTVPVGNDVERYCRLARAVDDLSDEFGDAIDLIPPDPDAVRRGYDEFRRGLAEVAALAPDEILGDIAVFERGVEEFFGALVDVDFDVFALDFDELDDLFESLEVASDRIEDYNDRVCGLAPDRFDDDGFGDDAFGDLGELGDLFGELGDLFAELEDFDLGPFAPMIIQALTEEFISEGYSPADAACLAEASLDFESLFDAFASGDPSAFDDLPDPFERCGVTPRN